MNLSVFEVAVTRLSTMYYICSEIKMKIIWKEDNDLKILVSDT